MDQRVKEAADALPPLTDRQRDSLARLLRTPVTGQPDTPRRHEFSQARRCPRRPLAGGGICPPAYWVGQPARPGTRYADQVPVETVPRPSGGSVTVSRMRDFPASASAPAGSSPRGGSVVAFFS